MSDAAPTTGPNSACPLPGYLDVAAHGHCVIVRLVGLGNMNLSLMFSDFISDCMKKTCSTVLLDLGTCSGMDSTFMGTLVSISGKLRDAHARMQLVNVCEHCRKLLGMLGIDQLLDIAGAREIPDLEFTRMEPLPGEPRRRLELIHRAHTALVEADARNIERFGPFLESLERELDRERRGGTTRIARNPAVGER